MSTESTTRLREVQRVSRTLRAFFILTFVLTVLGLLAALFGPEPRPIELVGSVFAPELVTAKLRFVWFTKTVLRAAVALKAFYHLIRLFGLYADGRIFTARNVGQIRQLGVTLLLLPALWVLVLLAVVPEIAATDNGWLNLLPSFPMTAGLGGGIVIMLAWIMDVGRDLRDEHELVI